MKNTKNPDLENLYDAVIIGGGPAGLTAAIYLARAKYRVIVVEKEQFGGQITITSQVVNYPGIESTSGRQLTEGMRKQAENFGAEFLLADADKIDAEGDIKKVYTNRGTLQCFGIILATGAHPRLAGFQGEAEFQGHGVAYCATCDGEFFTGKQVFVVGGGYAAAEESVFLTKYASHVTILVREEDFTCAESVAQQAKNNEKITVLTNTQVESVSGDSLLRKIIYKNLKTGEQQEYKAEPGETFGVFVFVGYEPATSLVKDIVELDKKGYITTDINQKTNVDGIYAAGDVCIKNLRQVVTAVGDGATAATELERYAGEMHKKTGLVPQQPQKVKSAKTESESTKTEETSDGGIFSAEVIAQMNTVFEKMERKLLLKLYLNNDSISNELKAYIREMTEHTDMILMETAKENDKQDLPAVYVCDEDGVETGLAFHGVPGGHEFTSFIIGLYNAAGPGQTLEEDIVRKIKAIKQKTDIQIMVSLSCTMCPELVIAAQKIAAMNKNVRAEVYDINHFPEKKEKYQVMSVPCYVINDETVGFGRKNIEQLLEII